MECFVLLCHVGEGFVPTALVFSATHHLLIDYRSQSSHLYCNNRLTLINIISDNLPINLS